MGINHAHVVLSSPHLPKALYRLYTCEETFISKDIFHICSLGVTRALVASLICYLVHMDHFVPDLPEFGRGVPQRLTKAYSVCACFCKQVLKESPHLKIFTKENLHWSSLASMPDSTMKASDVAMFLKWLCDYMSGPIEFDDVLELAFKAVCSMDDFMRLVYTADRIWLTRAEATQATGLLTTFLESYYKCSLCCFRKKQSFFNLTPKFHYLDHVRYDLRKSLDDPETRAFLNPAAWSTTMDEDFVGVVSRIGRNVHAANVGLRTVNRWLVYANTRWMDWSAGG